MMSRVRSAWLAVLGGRSGNLILATTLALLALLILRPTYFTLDNLRVIILNMSSVGIASVGMALLVISGNVDLSTGAIFAAAAFVAAWLALQLPAWAAIAGGLAAGGVLGCINGVLVRRIQVSPVIVTLGSSTVIRGMMLVLTKGMGIHGIPPEFFVFGRATPLGIPSQIWILVVIAIIGHAILSQTTLGNHIYAVGGNREASQVAGINIQYTVLGLFALSGILAALSGVLTASRFGSTSIQYGIGFELEVVTAVILGGVAFAGGEGTISGVMLAVAFLGIISTGLVSLGVDPFYTDVVRGGALILSILLEQLRLERNERYRKALAMADFAEQMAARRAAADQASDPAVG